MCAFSLHVILDGKIGSSTDMASTSQIQPVLPMLFVQRSGNTAFSVLPRVPAGPRWRGAAWCGGGGGGGTRPAQPSRPVYPGRSSGVPGSRCLCFEATDRPTGTPHPCESPLPPLLCPPLPSSATSPLLCHLSPPLPPLPSSSSSPLLCHLSPPSASSPSSAQTPLPGVQESSGRRGCGSGGSNRWVSQFSPEETEGRLYLAVSIVDQRAVLSVVRS